MKLTILTPTYNEAESIGILVPEIFSHAPDALAVVIDDNSPDGTASSVRRLHPQYPNLRLLSREKKEGLGRAYVSAFKEYIPTSEWILMMDADLSHHPKYFPAFFDAAKRADVIIGSRYIKGGLTVGWELWRRILSRYGNWYVRTITQLPLRDCTSGFMLIKTDFLKRIKLDEIDMSGYAFLAELKYLLWKAGARITEVPIVFNNRRGGESKISSHIINEGILAPWKMIFKK